MKTTLTICLLFAALSWVASFATFGECDCPPIDTIFMPCLGISPLYTSFLLFGGCGAEQDEETYTADRVTGSDTIALGNIEPGQWFNVQVGFSDLLLVQDSNTECEESFDIYANPGYSENVCPSFLQLRK